MKINGVEVTSGDEILVLPRTSGEDIVFRACAVKMNDFHKKFPEPKAPNIRTRSGFGPDLEDDSYVQALKDYSDLRFSYLCVFSLAPSKIEWEKVDLEKPSTWKEWEQELRDAGLSDIEMSLISRCILSANALDEAKLEEARESFLRGLPQ